MKMREGQEHLVKCRRLFATAIAASMFQARLSGEELREEAFV